MGSKNVLTSIRKSVVNELADSLSLLLLIWGGVAVADVYFNRLLGIDLISFIALIPACVAGFIYLWAMISKSRMGPNGIKYFNINGQTYFIQSDVTSMKNPGAAALILIAIKSLVALPVFIFKLILRIIQSTCSEKYRNDINEYYDTHIEKIRYKLKTSGILTVAYVLTIALFFGLYGIQAAIYSPKKVEIENTQVIKLDYGYQVNFTYSCDSWKINYISASSVAESDDVTVIIKDSSGNIVYREIGDYIMLDLNNRSENNYHSLFLTDLDYFNYNDYKIYLKFDEMECQGIFGIASKKIDYEVCIYG